MARAGRPAGPAAMLDLPFEHVFVSHDEPVHTLADFEAAESGRLIETFDSIRPRVRSTPSSVANLKS